MVFKVFFWNPLILWLALMQLSCFCSSSSSRLCSEVPLLASAASWIPPACCATNRKCPILHITPFSSYQRTPSCAFPVTGQQLGLNRGIYWGDRSSAVPPRSLSMRLQERVAQPGHPLAQFSTLGGHLTGVQYDGEVFETKTNHKKTQTKTKTTSPSHPSPLPNKP